MLSCDEFKAILERLKPGAEIEIWTKGMTDSYMIIKYRDNVSFQKCGYPPFDVSEYGSFDELLDEATIEGTAIRQMWDKIGDIVVNNTFSMNVDDDIRWLKNSYCYIRE